MVGASTGRSCSAARDFDASETLEPTDVISLRGKTFSDEIPQSVHIAVISHSPCTCAFSAFRSMFLTSLPIK